MSSDEFLTIREPGHAQTRVLGSRFLGTASPLHSSNDVASSLDDERKRYHDATHHCYAFRLASGTQTVERASDAGEPKGTAGQPILREIQGRELTHCLVIVTRYFGGTKLGTGGLARAYGECAALALDNAPKVRKQVLARMSVNCTFDDTGIVYHVAARFGAVVEPLKSENGASFEVRLARADAALFNQTLQEAIGGRAAIREEGIWIS